MGRKSKEQIATENKRSQLYISIICVAIILGLVMAIGRFGVIGQLFAVFFGYLFGADRTFFIVCGIGYFLCVACGCLRYPYFRRFSWALLLTSSALLLFLSINYAKGMDTLTFVQDFFQNTTSILTGKSGFAAGLFGTLLYGISAFLFDVTGTYIVIFAICLVALILLLDFKKIKSGWRRLIDSLFIDNGQPVRDETSPKSNKEKPTLFDIDDIGEVKSVKSKKNGPSFDIDDKVYQPIEKPIALSKEGHNETIDYHLPSYSLLDDVIIDRSNENKLVAKRKGEVLINLLAQFDINASLVDIHIGPSVTKFEIRPEVGVKLSRISVLNDDIKMALAAKDIRIEAPIPGHTTVGVEIPNVKMTPVVLKEVIQQLPNNSRKLTLPLGKDLQGKAIFMDLDKMPHLLVAGATGSGKSVCINSFVLSLMLRTTPQEVKLLMIDPKKVEFAPFAKLPHLITNVVTDANEAARVLKVLVGKMEQRYDIFKEFGVRNITSYHQMQEQSSDQNLPKIPFIIVIIDELADLMIVAGKEVESSIQRITQLARAAGIYLIVATQRPSTDVITGIIKANIPSRIAFAVSSGIDSRTILDSVGAERLLGNGDMLYYPSGQSNATRLQGVFVSDQEIVKISEFVSNQWQADFDADFLAPISEEDGYGVNEYDDPMYFEVVKFVSSTGKASTSLLQRRFRFGYNRAARLIDILEIKGIVGPASGSKPRQVFVKPEDDEDY